MRFTVRPATPEDAPVLARLINLSGQGVPGYSWGKAAGRTGDAMRIGADRIQRQEGNLSYTNARVAEVGGEVVGMILAYAMPQTVHYELNGVPDYLRPFVRLEGKAAQSFYVHSLAVEPDFRKHGMASRLLELVEHDAAGQSFPRTTVIVFAENHEARTLFANRGYEEQHSAPLSEHESHPFERTKLILMARELPMQQ